MPASHAGGFGWRGAMSAARARATSTSSPVVLRDERLGAGELLERGRELHARARVALARDRLAEDGDRRGVARDGEEPRDGAARSRCARVQERHRVLRGGGAALEEHVHRELARRRVVEQRAERRVVDAVGMIEDELGPERAAHGGRLVGEHRLHRRGRAIAEGHEEALHEGIRERLLRRIERDDDAERDPRRLDARAERAQHVEPRARERRAEVGEAGAVARYGVEALDRPSRGRDERGGTHAIDGLEVDGRRREHAGGLGGRREQLADARALGGIDGALEQREEGRSSRRAPWRRARNTAECWRSRASTSSRRAASTSPPCTRNARRVSVSSIAGECLACARCAQAPGPRAARSLRGRGRRRGRRACGRRDRRGRRR